jgi:hypothetical protein
MDQLYDDVLANMESSHSVLSGRVRAPDVVPFGSDGLVFRYANKGIHEALIQKLARVISGLHAARLLMRHGFFQEQAALQRMLDELNEDTMFLAHGVIAGELTELHRNYLVSFYEEEFDNPDRAIASTQKRAMVSRQKIRAYLSRIDSGQRDPSSGIEAKRTVHKLYSGFVHGASPHIMDMYLGSPPRWHLRGMLGTIREREHRDDLWNVFYRSIGSFVFTAKAFGDERLCQNILRYMRGFAAAAGETFAHPSAETEA